MVPGGSLRYYLGTSRFVPIAGIHGDGGCNVVYIVTWIVIMLQP